MIDSDDHRRIYLLGQKYWLAVADDHGVRWQMAGRDGEPADEKEAGESAFRLAPGLAAKEDEGRWEICPRDALVRYAVSDDPAWRRVGLVCGAGLGKTTTLEWLEAEINQLDKCRGKNLAFCLPLSRTPLGGPELLSYLVKRIRDHVEIPHAEWALKRLRAAGRLTLLFDSLDQAGPEPHGPVVQALNALFSGPFGGCRIWISGRPYAFMRAKSALRDGHPNTPWQFVRVAQLDKPEASFLLETTRRPGR